MKRSLVLLIALFSVACKKDEIISPPLGDSIEIQQHAGWTAEKFKSQYTIQFPSNYTGGYIQGFEGGSFDKLRDDSTAHMMYFFGDILQNFDFGDTLQNINADSIWVSQGDPQILLDHRIDFTENGITVGILFYNEWSTIRTGELYWNDDGAFKDALSIYYSGNLQEEVISILQTIKKL